MSGKLILTLLVLYGAYTNLLVASQRSTSKHEPAEIDMMMEAPDSPPEPSHAESTSLPSHPSSSQQTQQAGVSSGRVNGEGNTKPSYGAPGSSWQTKKFSEDYERAMRELIHQEWDACECVLKQEHEYWLRILQQLMEIL